MVDGLVPNLNETIVYQYLYDLVPNSNETIMYYLNDHYYKFGLSCCTQILIFWYNVNLDDHVCQEKSLYFVEEIRKT